MAKLKKKNPGKTTKGVMYKSDIEAREKDSKRRQKGVIFFVRVFGLFLMTLVSVIYVQLVPLLLIFLGGYMGIPVDAGINSMDTMIWILASLAMIGPLLYGYIKIITKIWHRMIIDGSALFRFKNKEKIEHNDFDESTSVK